MFYAALIFWIFSWSDAVSVHALAFAWVLLFFLLASAFKLFPRIQSVILTEGHQVGEIQNALNLLLIISAGMVLILALTWVFQ
jgi:hypothetical protein